ncbi:hypothetical protein Tco_0458735 [Tanacetum coccineum]
MYISCVEEEESGNDVQLIVERRMLYEFNIISTSLPDINHPNLTPEYQSQSTVLTFDTTHNSILNEELLSKKDALGERHLTLEHEVATLNEQLQRERELRKQVLIVPPEIVYGSKGVQEIPPNATIEVAFHFI